MQCWKFQIVIFHIWFKYYKFIRLKRNKTLNIVTFLGENLCNDCQWKWTGDPLVDWTNSWKWFGRICCSRPAEFAPGPIHGSGDHDHVDAAEGQHHPREGLHHWMGKGNSGRADQTCRRQTEIFCHSKFEWVIFSLKIDFQSITLKLSLLCVI